MHIASCMYACRKICDVLEAIVYEINGMRRIMPIIINNNEIAIGPVTGHIPQNFKSGIYSSNTERGSGETMEGL